MKKFIAFVVQKYFVFRRKGRYFSKIKKIGIKFGPHNCEKIVENISPTGLKVSEKI